MRIAKRFGMSQTQRELDFVNVDLSDDTPLFIDPFFLSRRTDRWSEQASKTVLNFFEYLVNLIKQKRIEEARFMFEYLGEPGETGLGLSNGSRDGKGMGDGDAERIFDRILKSKAVESGLIEDLPDTAIFVDRIGPDKISDMTTNIIRKHLLEYTIRQANLWGFPLTEDVPSGYYWDPVEAEWRSELTQYLIIDHKRVLLVPKSIVAYKFGYTPAVYHQHFILNFLRSEHLRLNTALVQTKKKKDGTIRKYVTKKSLKEKVAPLTRDYLRKFSVQHPAILEDFKRKIGKKITPIGHEDLEDFDMGQFCDYLIERLKAIPTGTASADDYHTLMIGLLDFLFYPNLVCPEKETKIHKGRKRIDITFDNAAKNGFFYLLHTVKKVPSSYIVIECKNYSVDPANPELDQLSSRFSPNRGKFGILACRKISDLNLIIDRCRDTYTDDRGLMIPITDQDIIKALEEKKKDNLAVAYIETILTERMRQIIMG